MNIYELNEQIAKTPSPKMGRHFVFNINCVQTNELSSLKQYPRRLSHNPLKISNLNVHETLNAHLHRTLRKMKYHRINRRIRNNVYGKLKFPY